MSCNHRIIRLHYKFDKKEVLEKHCKNCSFQNKNCGCLVCGKQKKLYYVVLQLKDYYFFCDKNCAEQFF